MNRARSKHRRFWESKRPQKVAKPVQKGGPPFWARFATVLRCPAPSMFGPRSMQPSSINHPPYVAHPFSRILILPTELENLRSSMARRSHASGFKRARSFARAFICMSGTAASRFRKWRGKVYQNGDMYSIAFASSKVQISTVLGIVAAPKGWPNKPQKVGCFTAHLLGLVLPWFGTASMPNTVDVLTSLDATIIE